MKMGFILITLALIFFKFFPCVLKNMLENDNGSFSFLDKHFADAKHIAANPKT